jgi:hypothetical protein
MSGMGGKDPNQTSAISSEGFSSENLFVLFSIIYCFITLKEINEWKKKYLLHKP